MAVVTAFDFGATASAIVAWARLSRASGIPISCTAWAAATAVVQRGRVGQPDVLAGQDHQPPGDEARVLAGLDHPRQVVQRRVGVGAAHRLDEGADDVVVLVALAVVAHRRLVDRGLRGRQVDLVAALRPGGAGGRLEVGQRAAGVAAGQPDQVVASLVAERGRRRRARARRPAPGRGPRRSSSSVERLQAQQQAARQQRRDHGEERVLGGGGDQRHPAVLHPGQQRVLLRLAEPVHLVDEQHRLATGRRPARPGRRRSPPGPP